MTEAEYNRATFALIVALRGGLPEKCDFCDQPYTEQRQPVPEEGGEWACTECLAKWTAEECGNGV